MNPFFASVLFFSLFSSPLFAQKKAEKPIQPYFAIATGYAETSVGTGFPLNVDYQWRYKKIGIGVGFGVEYVKYKYGSANRLYEIGENTCLEKAFPPLLFAQIVVAHQGRNEVKPLLR